MKVIAITGGGAGIGRLAGIHHRKEAVAAPVVPRAERPARRRYGLDDVVEPEPVLAQHHAWLQHGKDAVELVSVHLDMDGADGGAVGQHAKVGRQMLDRIVGEQRDPVVRADALVPQMRRDPAGQRAQLAVGQRPAVIGRDDECLVRIARGGARNPVAQQ